MVSTMDELNTVDVQAVHQMVIMYRTRVMKYKEYERDHGYDVDYITRLSSHQQILFLSYFNTKGISYISPRYIFDKRVFWIIQTISDNIGLQQDEEITVESNHYRTTVELSELWLFEVKPSFNHIHFNFEDRHFHHISLDDSHIFCRYDNVVCEEFLTITETVQESILSIDYPSLFPFLEFVVRKNPPFDLVEDVYKDAKEHNFTKYLDLIRAHYPDECDQID
jgi:hypothetical protein